MKNLLKQLVSGKRVLVLGFGREGRSTFRLLSEVGSFSELAVSDMKPVEIPENGNVKLYSGEGYLDILDEYDVVFKSPGVVLPDKIEEYSCRITSQTELFLMKYGKIFLFRNYYSRKTPMML